MCWKLNFIAFKVLKISSAPEIGRVNVYLLKGPWFLDFSRVCSFGNFSVGDRPSELGTLYIEKSLTVPKRSDTFSYDKYRESYGVTKFWRFWGKIVEFRKIAWQPIH